MWKWIARRTYTRAIASLSAGDVETLLGQFAEDVHFVFVGESPLGADLRSRNDVREWFGRMLHLLPSARFEPVEILVDGWPWDVRIAARVMIHSTIAGEP
jgi:ketosteroid isomerase-like protein